MNLVVNLLPVYGYLNRRLDPLSSVRIMMVTTETSMNQLQQALAAGANEYLMKPFTKELLLEKLSLLGIN